MDFFQSWPYGSPEDKLHRTLSELLKSEALHRWRNNKTSCQNLKINFYQLTTRIKKALEDAIRNKC